jgi:hypothetical protein
MEMGVRLSGDQVELLTRFAEAYEKKGGMHDQKEPIYFYTSQGGTELQHFSWPDEIRVALGDLQELDSYGLIYIRYGRSDMDGSFRVTGQGYDAVEQIKRQQQALAGATVVPEEGARMGLDWETEVFPVLRAVYDLYSPTTSSKGVMQMSINERLGREKDDPHTDIALKKLEEAHYVGRVFGSSATGGPMSCEPAPKALELLAGWPTDRGDAALTRLVEALEAQIQQTSNEEEKGRLKAVLAAVQQVAQEVMVGVMTKVITGG